MTKFLLGHDGRLILVGGKPLGMTPGAAAEPPSGTLSIKLVDWYMQLSSGYTTRFNIQTTAASNDTTADVSVVFTYTGDAPTTVQARVIDGSGTAVPGFDWTDITSSVTVNGGTGIGYLRNVPDMIDLRREVRVGTSTTIKSTDTGHFNVGTNSSAMGQSNMRASLDGGKTRDDAIPGTAFTELTYFNANGTGAFFGPNGFVAGGYNGVTIGSYSLAQGGGLSLIRLLGTALQNKRGRKVGVSLNPWALNATPISGFMDASGRVAMLANSGTTAGTIGFSSPAQIITGDYRLVWWHGGESETPTITRAIRLPDLIKLCQAHIAQVAKFGRPASKLTFLFAIMGVCGYNADGTPTHPHMEVLRGAVLDLIAYVKQNNLDWDVRIGWNCIDLDPLNAAPPDTIHFGAPDQTKSLLRMAQAAMNVVDPVGVPYGARGPMLTGEAVRLGDDVTLTVAHEGLKDDGTPRQLVAKTPGSALTGWYANTKLDFSGTELVVSGVTIVDSTHVRATVKNADGSAAPATLYIKYMGHKYYTALSSHPDGSNGLSDDFAYPTGAPPAAQKIGLPMIPTPDAIKVGP